MKRHGIVTGSHNIDMVQEAFGTLDLNSVCMELIGRHDKQQNEPRAGQYFDEDSFVNAILLYCDEILPVCVLANCVDDRVSIVESRLIAPLAEKKIPFLCHPLHTASIALDKWKTKEFGRSMGVAVPEGYIARTPKELTTNFFRNDDVLVFKRLDQSSGDGQAMIPAFGPFDQLEFDRGPYLVERFIEGKELSINVFASRGGLYFLPIVFKGPTRADNVHALERVRLVLPDVSAKLQQAVFKVCEKMCAAMDPSGWLEFEFVLTEHKLYLIEINARFSGTSRINWVATGVNPYDVGLKYILNGTVPVDVAEPRFVVELPLAQQVAPSTYDDYIVYYSSRPRPGRLGRQIIRADSLQTLCAKIEQHAPVLRREEFREAILSYAQEFSTNSSGII